MKHTPPLSKWCPAAQIMVTLALTFVLASPPGARADEGGASEPPESSASSLGQPSPLWLFGGLDAGISALSVDKLSETNKNGLQFNAKALLSYYWTHWVIDGGLGWQYNRVTGGTTPATETTITTRAGFVELSPRWRPSTHWQIGPTINYVFGTDLSFAPAIVEKNSVWLAGAQANYEFDWTTWRLRVGARALTDLTIENRQIVIAQGLIQIGIPLGGTRAQEPVAETPVPVTAIPEIAEPLAPAIAQIPVRGLQPPERGEIAVELGVGRIRFETASHKLTPQSERALRDFGKFLKTHDASWGRLHVDGHTDERGSFDYNLRLSVRRANSVRDAIIKGGASKKKLRAGGYSGAYPLVDQHNEPAWSKNRRVELQFFEVTDRQTIADGVAKFEKKLDSGR